MAEGPALPQHWSDAQAVERGEEIVRAMATGGIECLFFTSGSDIMFYQEAIARAGELGLPAPRLISMTHELTSLSAALGYCAASGRPAATAAHVDVGTQAYGAGVHNASRAGLPVVLTAGSPPTAYTGSMRGARDGGHFWGQQTFDQNAIVRQYMKWDHRLEYQDNPGLIISRALQVAQTSPPGPVYLSLPREITMMQTRDGRYPSVEQLGIPTPAAPDPGAVQQVARALVNASAPVIAVAHSGRDPQTVSDLVALCELVGMDVTEGTFQGYLCFPMNHPLYRGKSGAGEADVAIALDAGIPWIPGPLAPPDGAQVFVIGPDPTSSLIPTVELEATRRVLSDSGAAIRALLAEVRRIITADQVAAGAARLENARLRQAQERDQTEQRALRGATDRPIDHHWASRCVGRLLDGNSLLVDTTITTPLLPYLQLDRPGSFIHNPSTAGGWGSGAAFGAKLAQPDRDVILTTGDGFYIYDVSVAALSAAKRYGAPYLAIVFQNDSYNTGTEEVDTHYPAGFAASAGYDGGYLDPVMDFAHQAESAGAYGINVDDPQRLPDVLAESLQIVRDGTCAVVAIKGPRLSVS